MLIGPRNRIRLNTDNASPKADIVSVFIFSKEIATFRKKTKNDMPNLKPAFPKNVTMKNNKNPVKSMV